MNMLIYGAFCTKKRKPFPDLFEYRIYWLRINLYQINIF